MVRPRPEPKNRLHLDDSEVEELDTIMDEYTQERDEARAAMIAAQAIYHAAVAAATARRDDRILALVDAGGRGTTSRTAEHIGMHQANLSTRLVMARKRASIRDKESGTRIGTDAAPTSSTHQSPTQLGA